MKLRVWEILIGGGVIAGAIGFFGDRENAEHIFYKDNRTQVDVANMNAQIMYDDRVSDLVTLAYASESNPRTFEEPLCRYLSSPLVNLRVDYAEKGDSPSWWQRPFTWLFDGPDDAPLSVDDPAVEKSGGHIATDASVEDQGATFALVRAFVGRFGLCGGDGGGIDALRPPEDPPLDDGPRLACIGGIVRSVHSATASDRASGFHGRPSARTQLKVNPGDDRFLAQIKLVSETYRNRPSNIPPVSEIIAEWSVSDNLDSFIAEVACTNSKGTGRTCRSDVTIEVATLPSECLPFFQGG